MFHQVLNTIVALAIVVESLVTPTRCCSSTAVEGAESETVSTAERTCCGDRCRGCCRHATYSSATPSVATAAEGKFKACCAVAVNRSHVVRAKSFDAALATRCDCHLTNPNYPLAAESMSKLTTTESYVMVAAIDARVAPHTDPNRLVATAAVRIRPTAVKRYVELRRLLI